LEIVHRAQADTDYTIAYIDGRPAAISEKRSGGGHYVLVEDREYIYNQYARQCWYVKDGKWQRTLAARSFAQQDILVDVAVSHTRREVNDGCQKVYDGDLEEAFAD
jgi:saccharopine dehydrogenase-like NADP-dependent oxidoreductase